MMLTDAEEESEEELGDGDADAEDGLLGLDAAAWPVSSLRRELLHFLQMACWRVALAAAASKKSALAAGAAGVPHRHVPHRVEALPA